MSTVSHSSTPAIPAGWREWVALPEVGVPWIKAKLDSGARTSSLHAFEASVFSRDGRDWVRFWIQPWQRSDDDAVQAELPVIGCRPCVPRPGMSRNGWWCRWR